MALLSKSEGSPSIPNIEASPNPAPGQNGSGLDLRLRQQEILAELGVLSLQGPSLQELLDAAVRMAAEGLRAELSKVLEYIPAENRLLMRAGVGWDPGTVGVASVGADLDSPSGYALRTGKPVISNHLENEERFRTPELLRAHGVRRAINVILQGDGLPYGVLEVDSRSEGEFTAHDISFLQGAANILGMAIERQRYEDRLRAALKQQEMLIKEINHRVKNSLQLVSSMFRLQAQAASDPALIQALQAAAGRVSAVARAHERLYRDSNVRVVDLSAYLTDVCHDLIAVVSPCTIDFKASGTVRMGTDRAVLVAILVGELITNAAKHAYRGGAGLITVRLDPEAEAAALVAVRDDGVGLPSDFDFNVESGFGMRLVRAFLQPTGAELILQRRNPGTEFVIRVPLDPVEPTMP
ncbi:MAG TPA: histidine kinase dimerization/phosphoacceptor domain -containing protein [Bauldia sp.]|nr:histidine kinase dimerization/phosphoacceptor domain -containing protein [Bauldia sp.]